MTLKIIFTTGHEETHIVKKRKTIQFTFPNGAKVKTIKISSK